MHAEKHAFYVTLVQNVGLETRLWHQIVTSKTAHIKHKWPPYNPVATGGALAGLAPRTKFQAPQIETWNTISHCTFCQFWECLAPRRNVKPPYWKLSGDGSATICHWMKPPHENFLRTPLENNDIFCSFFFDRKNSELTANLSGWMRYIYIDLPYVPVWPGLSRFKHLSWCSVPVSKMSRNFTLVKFSKWTPAWWCIVMK